MQLTCAVPYHPYARMLVHSMSNSRKKAGRPKAHKPFHNELSHEPSLMHHYRCAMIGCCSFKWIKDCCTTLILQRAEGLCAILQLVRSVSRCEGSDLLASSDAIEQVPLRTVMALMHHWSCQPQSFSMHQLCVTSLSHSLASVSI